jgi:Divergent InlB B-repeat domain
MIMRLKIVVTLLLMLVMSACNPTPPSDETIELTVRIVGQGQVTSDPAGIDCTATCTESFEQGTQITLTATAEAGYRFSAWVGQSCTTATTCTFDLENKTSVQATFEVDPDPIEMTELTVTIEGNGQVTSSPSGLDCTETCNESFEQGTQITLTATPVAGHRFVTWEGQSCTTATTCTFDLSGTAMSVLARFEEDTGSTLEVVNDTYTVILGTTLYVGDARPVSGVGPEATSVLANDTDATEISSNTAASAGITLSTAGHFSYAATTVGTTSFSYTAQDAAGNEATATVTITTIPANPAYPDSRVKVLNPTMNPLNLSISGSINYAGDVFYMIPGTYFSTGFNLKPDQQLIGSGVEFVLEGLTLAPKSTRPTLTQYDGYPYALIRITNDVKLSGFNIDVQAFVPTPAHPTLQERHGISVSEFDAVTGGDIVVEELEVRNSSMVGINFSAMGAANSVTLRNVTVTNPGSHDTLDPFQGHGIILSNSTTNTIENVVVTGEKAGYEKIVYVP